MQIIACTVLPETKKKEFKEFTVNWKYNTSTIRTKGWAASKGHNTEPGGNELKLGGGVKGKRLSGWPCSFQGRDCRDQEGESENTRGAR